MLVRRLRKRNATVVVEANGEVLFLPTGDVGRWTNRFSQRILSFTRQAAPSNKRPRWAHYGKPLKSTFKASTTYSPARMKAYAAVGSTANHAVFVDQGTGIFGGNGPYLARILPPWQRGESSLYESTWVPPGSGHRVAPVMIKGQKGQHFFDEGLERAFRSMRMRSYQVPGEGASNVSAAINSVPAELTGFLAAGPEAGAFKAQLEDWRAWRDAAWGKGRVLGHTARPMNRNERLTRHNTHRIQQSEARKAERAKRNAEANRKRRAKAKTTTHNKSRPSRGKQTNAWSTQRKKVERALEKYFKAKGIEYSALQVRPDHTWTALVRGRGGIYKPRDGRW